MIKLVRVSVGVFTPDNSDNAIIQNYDNRVLLCLTGEDTINDLSDIIIDEIEEYIKSIKADDSEQAVAINNTVDPIPIGEKGKEND